METNCIKGRHEWQINFAIEKKTIMISILSQRNSTVLDVVVSGESLQLYCHSFYTSLIFSDTSTYIFNDLPFESIHIFGVYSFHFKGSKRTLKDTTIDLCL